jgi:parallel beta-helix repeat protein
MPKSWWKVMLAYCALATVLAADLRASSVKAQERWVSPLGNDFSDGSASRPWRTLQHAADKAVAGTTVHVLAGTYALSKPIVTEKSGTAEARIRFVSDPPWSARLVTSAEQAWANDGAYVDIEGFDISAAGSNTTILIHAEGRFDRVLGNRLHDVHVAPGACPSGAGVMVGGGADFQIVSGNLVYNIGPPVAAHCNQMHGIYVGTSNNMITNNLCFNNGGVGIHVWGSAPSHNLLVNNTLFGNWRGIVVGSQDAMPAQENYVANNIVYKHPGQGVYEQGHSGGNSYRNNLVYGNQPDFALIGSRDLDTLRAEPRFVHYTGNETGDYHLRTDSPALGRGTAEQMPNIDIEGLPRRQGQAPDLGAYQAQSRSAAASVRAR